jgi:hypothetical protein
MTKTQPKPKTTNKIVRYEKGHKIQRFLLLDKTPVRQKRSGQTFLNIFIKCTLP